MHGEEGGPGYLVIDGKIADDGSAKLSAKGTVTQNHAHGVFAMRGNNYSYDIKAQFSDTKGTGTRNEGAGFWAAPAPSSSRSSRTRRRPLETRPPGAPR